MKRMIAVLLLFSVLLGLAGCGEKQVAEVTTAEIETTQPGPVTLTVGINKSAYVTDYYPNHYTQWLEQQTGYRLEFQYFSNDSNTEDYMVETMVDSDLELPDLILDIELSKQTIDRFGAEGKLVNLAPYFEDKESAWWQRFEQLSEEARERVWAAMESPDGGIYGFPAVQESIISSMDYQVWINREWLDTLSLNMPTDPESLYTVLKAFKEKDPNGNGEADEIPLLGSMESAGGDMMDWLINMFLYFDDSTLYLLDEQGEAYVPVFSEKYRQAMQYIHRLYDEELISGLSFSATATDTSCLMEANLVGVLCGDVMTAFAPGDPSIRSYDALPLWGTGVINPVQVSISSFITKDCEDVEAAWNLLMVMSSEESSLIQRYGEEDIDWMWAQGGSAVMDGVEPQMRLFADTWTVTGNNNWRTVVATILTNASLEGEEVVPADDMVYLRFRMADAMWDSYQEQGPTPQRVFPAYGSSMEDQEKLRDYSIGFVTGRNDPAADADWQDFLNKFAYLLDEI